MGAPLVSRRHLAVAGGVVLLHVAALWALQVELHIRGDKAVRYERVAQVMAAAQEAGLRKIGFVTEPVH